MYESSCTEIFINFQRNYFSFMISMPAWKVIDCVWFKCCSPSFYTVNTSCGARWLLIINYFLKDILKEICLNICMWLWVGNMHWYILCSRTIVLCCIPIYTLYRSSNINEVTRAILNAFIQKLHNLKKAKNANKQTKIEKCSYKTSKGKIVTYSLICVFVFVLLPECRCAV